MPRLAAATFLLTLCGTTLAAPFTAERLFGVGDAIPGGEVTFLYRVSLNDNGDWAAMYTGNYGEGLSGFGVRSTTGFNILPGTTGLPYDGGDYRMSVAYDIDINPSGEVAAAIRAVDAKNQRVFDGVLLDGRAHFDFPGSYSSHEYLGQPTRFGVPRYIEYTDTNQIVLNSSSPDMPSGPHLGVNMTSRITFGADGGFTDQVLAAPDLEVADGVSVFRLEGSNRGLRVNRSGDVLTLTGLWGVESGIGYSMNGELLFTSTNSVPGMPGYTLLPFEDSMIDHNDEGQWVGSLRLLGPGANYERVLARETGEIIHRGRERQDWLGGQYAIPQRVDLVDGGNLIWMAYVTNDLQSPGSIQTLLYNQTVLLQAGITVVDGKVVEDFSIPGTGVFEVSPNGEWIAASLIFEDGSTAFYRLRIPSPGTAMLALSFGIVSASRRSRRNS